MNEERLIQAPSCVAGAGQPLATLARRAGILLYGGLAYAAGVAALLAVIATTFGLVPFPDLLPLGNPVAATLLNVALLVAFALQHSVMARKGFKERWTRRIHPAMERATYLLATAVAIAPLIALWQPLDGVVWSVGSPLAARLVQATALLGWAYLLAASFAINHFELFGLQQVWREFHGRPAATVPFRERWMYRFDRHPIMTGVLVGLWATPHMTAGHLQFALGMTLYVLVGVHFEERSLRRQWGEAYEAYRRRVPTLVPLPFARR